MNRLPAEWEAQSSVLLTWPRHDGAFANGPQAWNETLHCFREILAAIARFQAVLVSAAPGQDYEELNCWLRTQTFKYKVEVFSAHNDDVWVRDHGPIGVYGQSGLALTDFRFNGWGGKFDATRDDELSSYLHSQGAFADLPLKRSELILEGGALETDGQGSLLATRSSVLNPNRNGSLTQAQCETELATLLGVKRFLWLRHGELAGDDTDGHIDTLVRFAGPDTLLWQASGGEDDINHASLQAMHEELRGLKTADGQAYKLIALPSAGEHYDDDGNPLPASYANFLIINGAVLQPCYGVAQDQQVSALLGQAYPGREVIAIDCRLLIRQYGSLHCATMNIPA